MSELTLEARIENLNQVLAFVDGELEKMDCTMKAQMQIDIAVEEIYVNIAHYAYTPDIGEARIAVRKNPDTDQVEIEFRDRGVAFNPLEKEDPDTNLSAAERKIGGLGIFMVKKSMDGMAYAREDGQNILTISKKL